MDYTWNSPGENTGVGSLSLLQGIFPTQGLNPGLPHCRQILCQLSHFHLFYWGFPGGSEGKASAYIAGDLGSIPGLGRSPGEGNGYPLQYSGLENSMDRRAWRATVHRVSKNQTRLSNFHFPLSLFTPQPLKLKKLKLNSSMKTCKTF